MPYRPDPVFNDSLEPVAAIPARQAIGLTFAAILSLCFALVVSLFVLVRAAFAAPVHLLKKVLR